MLYDLYIETRTKKRKGHRETNHWSILWRVTACPSWEKIKQGSKSEKTNCNEEDRQTHVHQCSEDRHMLHQCSVVQPRTSEKNEIPTPFKSLRPEGGKMLTYLEAMRRPKKHMVNTLAIGITAILMVPSTDWPAADGISMESAKTARIRSIILWSQKHRFWRWTSDGWKYLERGEKNRVFWWLTKCLESRSFRDYNTETEDTLSLSLSATCFLPSFSLLSFSKPQSPKSRFLTPNHSFILTFFFGLITLQVFVLFNSTYYNTTKSTSCYIVQPRYNSSNEFIRK